MSIKAAADQYLADTACTYDQTTMQKDAEMFSGPVAGAPYLFSGAGNVSFSLPDGVTFSSAVVSDLQSLQSYDTSIDMDSGGGEAGDGKANQESFIKSGAFFTDKSMSGSFSVPHLPPGSLANFDYSLNDLIKYFKLDLQNEGAGAIDLGTMTYSTVGEGNLFTAQKTPDTNFQSTVAWTAGIDDVNQMSVAIQHSPQMSVAEDASSLYFLSFFKDRAKGGWNEFIKNKAEVADTIGVLTEQYLLERWYELCREHNGFTTSIWGDKGPGADNARFWIEGTFMADEPGHTSLVQSLQTLIASGSTLANNDLNDYVDAIRGILSDKDDLIQEFGMERPEGMQAAAEKRTIQDRFIGSVLWEQLNIKESNFPDIEPDKVDESLDTDAASFDIARLAGNTLAERELVPLLRSAFDPYRFVANHRMEESSTPGNDLAKIYVSSKQTLGDSIKDFVVKNVTVEKLSGKANQKQNVLSEEAGSFALEAGRIGVIDTLRGYYKNLPAIGQNSVLFGAGQHAVEALEIADLGRSSHRMSATLQGVLGGVKNEVFTDIFKSIGGDIVLYGESLERSSDPHKQGEGKALILFANKTLIGTLYEAVDSQQKSLLRVKNETERELKIDQILSSMSHQTSTSEANQHTALEAVCAEARADMLAALGKAFDSKKSGGMGWKSYKTMAGSAGSAGSALNAWKVLNGLKPVVGVTVLGAGLGLSVVAIGVIVDIVNKHRASKASEELEKLIGEVKDVFDKFKSSARDGIAGEANIARMMLSKGLVYRGEGVDEMLAKALGENGGNFQVHSSDLRSLDLTNGQLDLVFGSMIKGDGLVSYDSIYKDQCAAVGRLSNKVWEGKCLPVIKEVSEQI